MTKSQRLRRKINIDRNEGGRARMSIKEVARLAKIECLKQKTESIADLKSEQLKTKRKN